MMTIASESGNLIGNEIRKFALIRRMNVEHLRKLLGAFLADFHPASTRLMFEVLISDRVAKLLVGTAL